MNTLPNREQTQRIAKDLDLVASSQIHVIKEWRGNSYGGRVYSMWPSKERVYELTHWKTPIARFTESTAGVALDYFDARYHSGSTRRFQGRILAAMGILPYAAEIVRLELSKPTSERGIIDNQSK